MKLGAELSAVVLAQFHRTEHYNQVMGGVCVRLYHCVTSKMDSKLS